MSAAPQSSVTTDEVDLDNLDDEDDEPSSSSKAPAGRGGGGMGIFVSSFEREDPSQSAPENSIHGFAISGDTAKLKETIAKGGDVNLKDEYVSAKHWTTSAVHLAYFKD